MKTIRNIGDFTIQIRLYGRLIEIPVNQSIMPENFMMFDEKGRDEILNFLAIKLKKENYKIELIDFESGITCPCCGTEINLLKPPEESKNMATEEMSKELLKQPIKPKRGRRKK